MRLTRHALAWAVVACGAFANLLPILATATYADVTGDCAPTIKGVDLRPLSPTKKSDAIKMAQDERAPVSITAGFPIVTHRVEIHLAGRTVYSEEKSYDGKTTWSDVVAISDYGLKSVGLYEVRGVVLGAGGQNCSGGALIEVEGNPLTTPLGAAAAAVTAVGAVGVAASAVASARGPSLTDGEIQYAMDEDYMGGRHERPDTLEEAEAATKDPAEIVRQAQLNREYQRALQEEKARQSRTPNTLGLCVVTAIPALLMTAGMMAVGGGGGGAERRPAPPKVRVPYRPRFTVASIIGGLLAGAGGAVLLQQYSIRPLTGELAIQGPVIGLVIGLLLPSLFRVLAWRRLNRRIARAVERRSRSA